MNYCALHRCITFSLSSARCAQRQQNTECTKIHISPTVRIRGYTASLSAFSPCNVVHSVFINRNQLNKYAATYMYNGESPVYGD